MGREGDCLEPAATLLATQVKAAGAATTAAPEEAAGEAAASAAGTAEAGGAVASGRETAVEPEVAGAAGRPSSGPSWKRRRRFIIFFLVTLFIL